MAELTARNKAFVREYLICKNATQAAIKAGFSKRSAGNQGARLMKNDGIKAAISKGLEKAEELAGIDAAWVLTNLKEVVERCMQHQPIMVFDREEKMMVRKTEETTDPRTGEETIVGVYEFDSAGANAALKMLGQHLGMFNDKVEHFGKVTLEQLVVGSNEEPE